MSDIFEFVYGDLADSSATKFGVPPELFRSLIRSESGFDPDALNPSGAAGIAQFMPGTAREMDIDPYDYPNALNASAQYLQRQFQKYGNWQDAISQYKGYGNNLSAGYDKALNVIRDSGLNLSDEDKLNRLGIGSIEQMQSGANNKPIPPASEKSLWNYNAQDWKNLFSRSALTVLFVFIGLLIIVASTWSIFKKS